MEQIRRLRQLGLILLFSASLFGQTAPPSRYLLWGGGSYTNGNVPKFDARGRIVDSGAAATSIVGFANPMTAVGDLIYGGTAGAATRLAPNTLASKRFLTMTGTGEAGQAPAWADMVSGDIPDLSAVYEAAFGIGTWAGTSNVTTLGTITTGVWNGTAILDAYISNAISLTDITQITNRSHTSLTDIGSNTHAQIDTHLGSTSNPHTVTKTQVGLTNVEDTALSTWAGTTSITTLGTISTGTFPWANLSGVPSTFAPSSHASAHQNGGADEVATATAAANAIPKAGAGGTLATGWIPDLSATYEPTFGIGTWTGTVNVGLVGTTLKLGGATSSYSALLGASNGTGIAVRDATNSTYHSATAAGFYAFSGGFIVPTKSKLNSTTDGYWTMTNAAGDGFTALRFGGATSSFPAIKRDGTSLRARLADDNADTGFFALPAFVAGNVAIFGGSAQPTSGYIPKWDASGRIVEGVAAPTGAIVGTSDGQILTGKTIDGDDNDILIRTHATDCTAITDGLEGEMCLELDADALYSCQPTAGGCDTAIEWILVSGDGGTDDQVASEVPFTPAGTIAATNVQAAIEEVATEATGVPGGVDGEIQVNNSGAFDGRGIGTGLSMDGTNLSIDTSVVARKAETEAITGARTYSNDVTVTGAAADVDLSGANTTISTKTGTSAPGTCATGELFYDTDADAGMNLFGCTATDTWTLQGDGGGAPAEDSVGTSGLDDGSDTPASGEYVRVDTVDQAGFEYRSTAEVLSDIGAAPITHSHAVAVELVVFDFATDTAIGDGKYYFVIPSKLNGWNLTAVSAQVISVGTTGTLNVDLARCDVAATGNACSGTVQDMLSTNLTIDSNEGKSSTAEAAAAIDTDYDDVDTDEIIRVDVDAVHTTAAKGLILNLKFEKP